MTLYRNEEKWYRVQFSIPIEPSTTLYSSSTWSIATFKLPTRSLYSLRAKLSFNVVKIVDATVLTQKAYGNCSHSTQNISLENAKKYTIAFDCIFFNNNSVLTTAIATWEGKW